VSTESSHPDRYCRSPECDRAGCQGYQQGESDMADKMLSAIALITDVVSVDN